MSNPFDLTGRRALVTGANTGIGQAIAAALAQAGAEVICAARRACDETVSMIADAGGTASSVLVDFADPMSGQGLFDGRPIDILVNNAGITRDATFRKLSYADWDAVLRVNLDSVFNVTRPFIDGMLERGWGRIVNIASINGSKGQFGQTNYSAAKAGMHGFTKALAQEVARKGVTVNTVSPGYLDTKMVTSMSEEVVKQVIAGIPVGRLGRPEEIAALVAFIVSESAGFMTGSNVSMNGGQHMY